MKSQLVPKDNPGLHDFKKGDLVIDPETNLVGVISQVPGLVISVIVLHKGSQTRAEVGGGFTLSTHTSRMYQGKLILEN